MYDEVTLTLQLLSGEEIQKRIKKFNENYDYSVFDDVPPEQHYAVLYPHVMKTFDILSDELKSSPLAKRLNEVESQILYHSKDYTEPNFALLKYEKIQLMKKIRANIMKNID